MSKPTKSDLCHELEKKLSKTDYVVPQKWDTAKTTYVIDVMGYMRRVQSTLLNTFEDICKSFADMIIKLCPNANRIDFVFDSYIEGSVKDSERKRRCQYMPIEVNNLKLDTPLPVEMGTFWASSNNKSKLQKLLKKYLMTTVHDQNPNLELVLSGAYGEVEISNCYKICQHNTTAVSSLDLDIEEADVRIIPHALDAVTLGSTRVVLMSNDTDVLVISLCYWDLFKAHGLKELWMRGGVADTTRYIPLHTLAMKIGQSVCKLLPALHHLTGSDSTSKFGTKLGALTAKPDMHLSEFGRHPVNLCLDNAEEYLVKIIKPGAKFKTMDELRYYMYHQTKKSIADLPPTSRATRAHILRAFHGTYIQLHCLTGAKVNPIDFGFYAEDDILKPIEDVKLIPDDLPVSCKCAKCATRRCSCRDNSVPCCIYCSCQGVENACKNPNVVLRVPVQMNIN